MNHQERVTAVLHYQPYDRMPLVSFGYWPGTLDKWASEGHIDRADAEGYRLEMDNSPADRRVMDKLGFDFNWCSTVGGNSYLFPPFQEETLETKPDGSRIIRNGEGLIEKVNDKIVSIPAMVGTSLTGREAWEELYLPKLRFSADRVDANLFETLAQESAQRELPLGLQVGRPVRQHPQHAGRGGVKLPCRGRPGSLPGDHQYDRISMLPGGEACAVVWRGVRLRTLLGGYLL